MLAAANSWAATYKDFFEPFNVGGIELGMPIQDFETLREKAILMTPKKSSSSVVSFSEIGEISKTGTSAYYYYFVGGKLSAIKYSRLVEADHVTTKNVTSLEAFRNRIESSNLSPAGSYSHIRTTGTSSSIHNAELWESEDWGEIKLYFSTTNLDLTFIIYDSTSITESAFFTSVEKLPEFRKINEIAKQRLADRGISINSIQTNGDFDGNSHNVSPLVDGSITEDVNARQAPVNEAGEMSKPLISRKAWLTLIVIFIIICLLLLLFKGIGR